MIISEASRKFNTTNIGSSVSLPYIIVYGVQESLPEKFKTKLDIISILEALSKYNNDDESFIKLDPNDPKENTPTIKNNKSKYIDTLQYMLDNDKDENLPNSKLKDILRYMLDNDTDEDISNSNSKLKDVLRYMLDIDIETDVEIDNGSWKLICFKKNSPSHNNKERQYDLYRLANEKLMTQLKETLGIDYFALNYTTKQPTELERYLGNVKPMLQDCNCQIMAFTEDHKPLPQFCGQGSITHVYLQKTNDKNTFNLLPGSFPVFKEPSKTYTNEQFIQTIDNTLRNSDDQTKKLIEQCSIYYNKVLEVVYNDLKTVKNTANYNLADFIVTQFVTKNEQLTGKIKDVFNDLLASTANPIIGKLQQEMQNNPQNQQPDQNNPNQQQSNQNDQQLLTQFETQFKQQLPTNQNYIKLKQELQKT